MSVDPLRNNRTPWSPEDLELLRRLYPHDSNAALARIFGRSKFGIKNAAAALGLRKSDAYMDAGPGRFKEGQETWNKGMKGLCLGGKATRFQKGQKPATWQPIGSERVSAGYLQRKISDTGYPPRDWRPVHHLVWEEHTGQPVPEGYVLAFRDGNARNVDPDNLELVSRADVMRRNTYLNLPPELQRVIQLKGALVRVINNRSVTP